MTCLSGLRSSRAALVHETEPPGIIRAAKSAAALSARRDNSTGAVRVQVPKWEPGRKDSGAQAPAPSPRVVKTKAKLNVWFETKLLRSNSARGGVFARGQNACGALTLISYSRDQVFYDNAHSPLHITCEGLVKFGSKLLQNPRLEPNSTLKPYSGTKTPLRSISDPENKARDGLLPRSALSALGRVAVQRAPAVCAVLPHGQSAVQCGVLQGGDL